MSLSARSESDFSLCGDDGTVASTTHSAPDSGSNSPSGAAADALYMVASEQGSHVYINEGELALRAPGPWD
jgi:hypothetical protein